MGVSVREKIKGSGDFWIFITHNGRRKSKFIGDEKQARIIAKKVEAKLVLEGFGMLERKPKEISFGEVATQWLSIPNEHWKESTKKNYSFNLTKHIYPVFKNKSVTSITRKGLKEFLDRLLVKGLSKSTVNLIKVTISGVLAYAVESEIIKANPAKEISFRKTRHKKKIIPLDEDQAVKLLDAMNNCLEGWYRPVMLFALRTGARIGEMQALRWDDIDFEKRSVAIFKSWRRGVTSETKNRKARTVDLSLMLTDVLHNRLTQQKKHNLKAGRKLSPLVFANRYGRMLDRASFRNALNKGLNIAELPYIRIHDLRHTYATIRLLRGHNIGDVSYQMGHSSISITFDIYGHWVPGKFKGEVDDLDTHQSAPYTHPSKTDAT